MSSKRQGRERLQVQGPEPWLWLSDALGKWSLWELPYAAPGGQAEYVCTREKKDKGAGRELRRIDNPMSPTVDSNRTLSGPGLCPPLAVRPPLLNTRIYFFDVKEAPDILTQVNLGEPGNASSSPCLSFPQCFPYSFMRLLENLAALPPIFLSIKVGESTYFLNLHCNVL